ncbi:hypothetical protein SAMN05444972_11925 [Marininema halotolerans]|uniref:Uncharacterized protein n=1 Tax=Marininema halotolerans TaxID=1155944 RepID=A0A1I6UR73_9BACL|nr:hypothetical protein SAMN05444972_11925 [Marininema halotolerans]
MIYDDEVCYRCGLYFESEHGYPTGAEEDHLCTDCKDRRIDHDFGY